MADQQDRAKTSAEAAMGWEERIELNPEVLVGKPVVRGTRLSVEFVLDRLADGWTMAELVGKYSTLTREDVFACLRYASEVVRADQAEQLLRV